MGSGSLAAISILESKYRDDLGVEDAKALVIEAVEAGIVHDLGFEYILKLIVIKKKLGLEVM